MTEEEKLCKSCIYYQFKYGQINYWQCKKGRLQLVDNKCHYYRKRKENGKKQRYSKKKN